MIEAIDNFFIEIFFGSNSAFLDHLALVLTNTWTWLPFFLALIIMIIKNYDNVQIIMLCLACVIGAVLISSFAANVIAKPFFERVRPCNTDELRYYAQIAGDIRSKDFSFFSSHAANAMAISMFCIMVVRSLLFSGIMLSWTLLFCWTRLYLGQHYFSDVVVGVAFGTVVGLAMYYIFRMLSNAMGRKLNFISSQYTVSGYAFSDIDIVVSVFVLIIIYALMPFSIL